MYVESHFGWRSKIILPVIRPMTRASPLTGIIRISSPSDKESLNISCQGCLLTLCFDNVIPSLSDSLRDSILHQKANHFRVMGTWVQTTAVSSWPQLGVLGCLFFRTRPSPPSWLKIIVESWGGNFSVSASSPFLAPSVRGGVPFKADEQKCLWLSATNLGFLPSQPFPPCISFRKSYWTSQSLHFIIH